MASEFVARLRRGIIQDLEPEILLAQQVAVLQAAGHRRSEISRILTTAGAPALRVAEARVKRVALMLDQGDSEDRA